MDKILQEYHSVFKSLVGVPTHCQVKHSIDLILGTPLLHEPIYRRSFLENDEIKRQIQELIEKGQSGQVLHLVVALLFWQEKKMAHGDFVLITGHSTRLL